MLARLPSVSMNETYSPTPGISIGSPSTLPPAAATFLMAMASAERPWRAARGFSSRMTSSSRSRPIGWLEALFLPSRIALETTAIASARAFRYDRHVFQCRQNEGRVLQTRYTDSMAVAMIEDTPLAPPSDLGPYRREDYESLVDSPRCELILGRFYLSRSPSILHQIVVSLLWQRLHEIARSSGGLALLAPLDVSLAEHSVVQPDVIYVSAERRGIARETIEGAPDLLVEVLSPGSVRRDRGEKLGLYAQSGVREYWIVDPGERQIEFLVNESGRFMVALPSGSHYQSQAMDEVRLDLAELWLQVEDVRR